MRNLVRSCNSMDAIWAAEELNYSCIPNYSLAWWTSDFVVIFLFIGCRSKMSCNLDAITYSRELHDPRMCFYLIKIINIAKKGVVFLFPLIVFLLWISCMCLNKSYRTCLFCLLKKYFILVSAPYCNLEIELNCNDFTFGFWFQVSPSSFRLRHSLQLQTSLHGLLKLAAH